MFFTLIDIKTTILFAVLLVWLSGCGGSQDGSTDDNGPGEPSSDAINTTDTSDKTSADTTSDTTSDTTLDTTSENSSVGVAKISVNLKSAASPPIVYAIWVENRERTFVQNLYICQRLLDNTLTGTALPFWSIHKKTKSDIDGLSGATIVPELLVTRELDAQVGRQFTVFVEADHSFDDNDWFKDQPALLYSVDVDLSKPLTQYQLNPIGWTKASQNKYTGVAGSPTTANGELNTELRYITHTADNDGFGVEDSRSAITIFDSLTASFK